MRQNVGTVRGIWKENVIRDGDEGSPGYGILVEKERECGIRTLAPDPINSYLKIIWLSQLKVN